MVMFGGTRYARLHICGSPLRPERWILTPDREIWRKTGILLISIDALGNQAAAIYVTDARRSPRLCLDQELG
jgi:hypothetical protein